MRATVVVAVVCGAIASQLVGAGVQWMRRSGVEAPQGVARVGSRSLTVHDLSASDRARLRELELETFAARYDAAARAATERMVAMAARDERLAPADYVRRELETRRSPPLQESGLGGSPEVSVSPTHARAGFDAWRRFVRARQLSVPASIEPSAAVLESGVASFTRLVDWSVAAGKSGPVRDDVVLAGRELVERLRRRFAVRIEVEAPAQPERTALEVLGLAGPLARASEPQARAAAHTLAVVLDPTDPAAASLAASVDRWLRPPGGANDAPSDRGVAWGLAYVGTGPDANLASVALWCADRQGRAFGLHTALLATLTGPIAANLAAVADQAGIDRGAFQECLASTDAARRVSDQRHALSEHGLVAPVTFLVDGIPLGPAQARFVRPLLDVFPDQSLG